jgi:hypothetical protein
MKLASLKHGRDGRLVVVSRDLSRFASAQAIAPTLQAALDDWTSVEPRLTEIADSLEADRIAHGPFDPGAAASPLPRAFQWADGSAYVNHVALVRKARGVDRGISNLSAAGNIGRGQRRALLERRGRPRKHLYGHCLCEALRDRSRGLKTVRHCWDLVPVAGQSRAPAAERRLPSHSANPLTCGLL